MKDLISDFREDPVSSAMLKETIVDTMAAAGLYADCPYTEEKPKITVSDLEDIADSDFIGYMNRVFTYLQVVENRLFSRPDELLA